jgi:hypothetical protein
MKQSILLMIDKEELYEYIHNGLVEQDMVVRQFVLEYIIDEMLDYLSMSSPVAD